MADYARLDKDTRRLKFLKTRVWTDRRFGTGDWIPGEIRDLPWEVAHDLLGPLGGGHFKVVPPHERRESPCVEPGCTARASNKPRDDGRCYRHSCQYLQRLKQLRRRMGKCGCGQWPTPGHATCAECRRRRNEAQQRYRWKKRRRDRGAAWRRAAAWEPDQWRGLRRSRGYSIRGLATESGVSVATIRRLEASIALVHRTVFEAPLPPKRKHRPQEATVRALLRVLDPDLLDDG